MGINPWLYIENMHTAFVSSLKSSQVVNIITSSYGSLKVNTCINHLNRDKRETR
jgi:uncharacterized membrane-anchored protein YitT (DUF2179 family)